MITKISKVKSLASFSNYCWDDETPEFTKNNIVFGYNGSGKTTISNILFLFSESSQSEKDELLSEISNNIEDVEIELQLDSEKIKYSKGDYSKKIYTFNRYFVSKHIYNGATTNCKLFDDKVITSEQLKNPAINKLEQEIIKKNDEKNKLEAEKTTYEEGFETIRKQKSKIFNEKVGSKRITNWNIPDAKPKGDVVESEKKLEKLFIEYELSQNQEDIQKDIIALKAIKYSSLFFDVESYKVVIKTDLNITSREKVESRLKSYSNYKLKKAENISDWFEDGLEILNQNNINKLEECPLCHNKVLLQSLIEEYQSFFNDDYKKLSSELISYENSLKQLLNNYSSNSELLSSADTLLKKYTDFIKDEYKPSSLNLKTLQNQTQIVFNEISEKKKDYNYNSIDIDNLSSLKDALDKYNSFVNAKKAACDDLLQILESQSLDENKIANSIKSLIKDLGDLEYDSLYDVTKYLEIINKIDTIAKELSIHQRELSTLISKMKNESKYVNYYLKRLGIHNFEIDIDKTKAQENISVRFDSGINKNKLMNCLSEGEKTSLAFAYFLSKLQYEIVDNTTVNMEDCIIVIDDPVSSLDENRLFITAFLIESFFSNASQLFVLSHNLVFLKYFGNIVKSDKRNDYFIDQHNSSPSITMLPKSLNNFKTAYFNKMDDIIDFNDNKIAYEDAKKYLPSYIRVVLETFLSFKFYILKQGSGTNHKYLSAGLDKIINYISGQIGLFKNFPKVGEVESSNLIEKLEFIKKTTDPQCHGTPQNIDEFNFTSENELRLLAKDTIDIIKFIDKMHFDKVSGG